MNERKLDLNNPALRDWRRLTESVVLLDTHQAIDMMHCLAMLELGNRREPVGLGLLLSTEAGPVGDNGPGPRSLEDAEGMDLGILDEANAAEAIGRLD